MKPNNNNNNNNNNNLICISMDFISKINLS